MLRSASGRHSLWPNCILNGNVKGERPDVHPPLGPQDDG